MSRSTSRLVFMSESVKLLIEYTSANSSGNGCFCSATTERYAARDESRPRPEVDDAWGDARLAAPDGGRTGGRRDGSRGLPCLPRRWNAVDSRRATARYGERGFPERPDHEATHFAWMSVASARTWCEAMISNPGAPAHLAESPTTI